MNATRRFRLRLAVPIAAGAVLLAAVPASAATTVLGKATGGAGCVGIMDTVQLASTSATYAVPGAGTITDWSTTLALNIGSAGLLVWRPTATAGTYSLVGSTTPAAMVLGTNSFHLTTPIPVQAGDLLGLHTEGRMDCAAPGATGDSIGLGTGMTGTTESFNTDLVPLTVDVSATFAPASSGGGGGTGKGCKDKAGKDEPDKCDKHDHDKHDHDKHGDHDGKGD
jgi:hypothetical protein